ncbi:MAG: pyridoxal phosphate-dependent aminotransferase family protein [Firmicutes bacterium]|nr:pyridoxal phosphate-dependent aminotransferase family protein [Bacillota bacterium]
MSKVKAPLQRRINAFSGRVSKLKEQDLYFYLQEIDSLDGARVTINGESKIMFSSYSYLGLVNHPRINEAANKATCELGTGTHGVRILAGTTRLHVELEKRIAEFMKAEDSIVFSSGFLANVATISSFMGRGDVVISDKLAHASLVDGCRLSGSEFLWFNHNDLDDLERILRDAEDTYRGKLVMVDAVYSMDGDIAPVPQLIELCRKYGAWLLVDEAHSLGVLGKTGHGIQEYFNITPGEIDIITCSLSKTIPSVGGFVSGRQDFISFLHHTARGFVFSASLSPGAVAAAKESFDVIEEEQWRITRLCKNINMFTSGLRTLGYNLMNTESSVIPIIIGDEEMTLALTMLLHKKGIFICPILPPAVPRKTCRLRANVLASHTEEDIKYALDCFKEAGAELGVISPKERKGQAV